MRKTRTIILTSLMSLSVVVSCVLRFLLLLNYTDEKTGLVTQGNDFPLYIYAFVLIAGLLAGVYSIKSNDRVLLINDENNDRGGCVLSMLLAVTFFEDFVHQGFNCYNYVSRVSYVEYTYLIPLAISGVLAVVCCFYFVCVGLTLNGSNYDFRNFTLLHFVPVLWGFIRLITMMIKIIDIKLGIETVIEFLFLSFMLMFFFCYISTVDNKGKVSKLFVFSAIMTAMLSAILTLPRIVMIIAGKDEILSSVTYSCLCYMAIGIFAGSLSRKTLRKD